jgi:hypothetical protein
MRSLFMSRCNCNGSDDPACYADGVEIAEWEEKELSVDLVADRELHFTRRYRSV